MKIIKDLLIENPRNNPQVLQTPKKICIHYSGVVRARARDLLSSFHNVARGDNMNPNHFTSCHYIVDYLDEIVYKPIEDHFIAYAASGNNQGVIHIEVCYDDESGEFSDNAITVLSKLVPQLMEQYNIPASKVVRHYDLTGKFCPMYYAGAKGTLQNRRWEVLHSQITTRKKNLFRIQVGAFENYENAKAFLKTVKVDFPDAFIVGVNNE